MNETSDTAELLTLLDALCNAPLESSRLARLQELLRDNPPAQQTYLDYLDLHLGLKHVVGVEAGRESSIDRRRADATPAPGGRRFALHPGRPIVLSLLVLAGVTVAAFAIIAIMPSGAERSQVAARIADVSGRVLVYAASGEARAAALGMDVLAGERVETTGPGALAVMAYDDGTRLAIVNDSSVMCAIGTRKSVTLHHGIVSAQVAPQPEGEPMLLTTPGAKIEVLGTRFAVSANRDRTELNVLEGQVRLTRVADGRMVEVAQGQGVVTNGEAALAVRESSGPRDAWEADFEHGVPKGWRGTAVAADLPAGSDGAIQAVRESDSEPVVYVIASREEWMEGLFGVHDDSHLHVTMKMEHPDWLNVFLMTRGADETNPSWAMHNFNEVPFWPPRPGQWRTVTIPLARFRRKRDGVFHNEPPLVGEVAYALSISATEPDRGLVVDRMWVTRGGPGEVEAKPLP